ncbi:hypothetical protein AVEN_114604-1 [Araneus ventricosus]|uniref:RNase H type-1 domain-containing protein n=1 Tax=Araneus ventricosus TaxID=182803 RepID=A0A4Y2GC45_ARAVE|nr:hypothetical protein AVEN_114604-1 [Araneus ventricosus]
MERTLAHGVSGWSRNLTQRLENKLRSIQRPILLSITCAYRTTLTAALQVIAGLMSLHLKIKLESEYVRIPRLRQNIVVGGRTFQPSDYEDTVHGWHNHPAECIKKGRINSEEDIEDKEPTNIFTGGSMSELGVVAAFCILDEQQELHHSWQTRLQEKNSVYQAGMVTIYEAVKYAVTLKSDIKIGSDNQSSLKTIANGSASNKMDREIQTVLLQNTNISLGWIRAHVRHPGNEMADYLANCAITTVGISIHHVSVPRCSIKGKLTE